MTLSHLPLLLASTLVQAQAGPEPADVVRQVYAAVEGGSAGALERRWRGVLERDPADRTVVLGLATLAHLTYRDTLAERLYGELLPAAGAAPDAAAGYAALGLARLVRDRGDWPRADSIAALGIAAGRAAADSALLAEALAAAAGLRARVAGPATVLPLLDEAAAAAAAADLRVQAAVRCARGAVLSPAGDAQALELLLSGAELARRADAPRIRAGCLATAAAEYSTRGNDDSALVVYEDVIEDFRRARDRVGLAVALQRRSHLYWSIGWLGRARRDAQDAIAHAEAGNVDVVAPWALSTLAWVAFQLGDAREAALHAARATELFRAQGDRFAAIIARELEATLSFAVGELAEAREAYAALADSARQIGWTAAEVNAREGLMHAAAAQGDRAAARREAMLARAAAERSGLSGRAAALGYHIAVLTLRDGELDEAERLFREHRASTPETQGNWRYLAGARLAEALARRGRLAEAERELLDASHALDDWRAELADRDLRLLALQLAEDRADPDLGVATVIAALARDGRLASAFEIVERGRARDLSDRPARAAALDTVASGTAVRRSDAPILLDSLQRALPDDSTALLEFVTGRGDSTTLFVITRRDARAYVRAPQDSLAPRVARFGVLLESGEDPRALGRELGAALLAPVLADLDPAVRRLVVVPDGPLHRLPFDALVLPDGRFAVERFAVATVPSAAVAARLWERRTAAPPAGLAVLADPTFASEADGGEGAAEAFRAALAAGADLPRLRGSAREARVVARYAPGALVRRRRDASEAWLKRAPLADYGVLHFATHALVDEGSLSNTALALAPADGEDGFLGPGELAELELAAELVVLSACRTAGGVVVRGEGVQGLAAPLLAAGARAVAATWWPIGDAATVRFVDDFYRGMAAGTPAGDALWLAKLAALERGAPAREWAAFTIVGDPLALPPLRPPAPGRGALALLTGAGILLLGLAYGLAMRRRRASERASEPSASSARTHQR